MLDKLTQLDMDQRSLRARLLWEELAHLEERQGKGVFSGEYTWTHYGNYKTNFDAAFVRKLNSTEWVLGPDGNLERPEFVVFETLGWKANPFLQSKILFKPRIIETLANEVGIEPGALDLLKKLGLTSEAELRAKLAKAGILEPQPSTEPPSTTSVGDAIKNIGVAEPTPPITDLTGPDPKPSGNGGIGSRSGTGAGATSSGGQGARANGDAGGESQTKGSGEGNSNRTPGSSDGRLFISYVAAHPEDEGPDPDGLDHDARMVLEIKAIDFILTREPQWQRTNSHNPGFDLFVTGLEGKPKRWCEVKAMTGSLQNRPVGLSRRQFECAQEHGTAYWLYVVEHAGSDQAQIVRIQDPAGKARTFTFDHGWLSVADADDEREEQKD